MTISEAAPQDPAWRSGPLRLWQGYKWLTTLGWPRRFQVVQFPNLPLIVALIAGLVAGLAHGTPHFYASALSYLAMSIWAYGELVHGSNWFRHLLGLGFLISTLVQVAQALQG